MNASKVLKINIISNFFASFWGVFLSILTVPVYLRYLGVDVYGIIGIFNSVQAIIALLDFGFSPAYNREISRLSAFRDKAQEIVDLTRTLEIINWGIALLIASILVALSPLIAKYWVHSDRIPSLTITHAFIILSLNIALYFVINFYANGIMGLQKQFVYNVFHIIIHTLRAAGSILILQFVSNTIEAFLIWQVSITFLQTVTFFLVLKFSLPRASSRACFRLSSFRQVKSFAVGMAGCSLLGLILSQTDKVILSRMLSLDVFGYYTLATTISTMGLGMILSSISNVVYPKFSSLVASGSEQDLRRFYHHSCQFMSVLLIPATVILAFFSPEILLLWTRNETIAANTYQLLTIVAVSIGVNGLMWLPSNLQLAHGGTRLPFRLTLLAILLLIPMMIFGVRNYGAIGGAASLLITYLFLLAAFVYLMHRNILKGEQTNWFFRDVLPPLLASLGVVITGKLFLIELADSFIKTFLCLAVISLAAYAGSVLSTKYIRERMWEICMNFYMSHIKKLVHQS